MKNLILSALLLGGLQLYSQDRIKLKTGMEIRAQVQRIQSDTVYFTNVGQTKVLQIPTENVISITYSQGNVEYPNPNHVRSAQLNRNINLRIIPLSPVFNHLAIGAEFKMHDRTSVLAEFSWIGFGGNMKNPDQGGALGVFLRRYVGNAARKQPKALVGAYWQGTLRMASYRRYDTGNTDPFLYGYEPASYHNQTSVAFLLEYGYQGWLHKKVSIDLCLGLGVGSIMQNRGTNMKGTYQYGYALVGESSGVALGSRIALTWNLN
jgi:hypothetical protein